MGNGSDLIIRLLVDDADLDKVDQSKARFDAWGDALKEAAKPAAVAVAALGAAAVLTTRAASDAQQSAGAVESVFGAYAGLIEENASVAATAVGLTQAAYSNMAAIIGAQLQNIGVPMEDVAGQTDELIALGADLAATFGGTTADAVAALSSLLRGETDPIEQYGVSIKEADINAQLAAMGLAGLEGEAAKTARTQALLSLLTDQTSKAQGQFARETDTAAGQTQIMQARVGDAAAKIGALLLPAVTAGAAALGDFADWAGENAGLVTALAVVVGTLAVGILVANAALKVYAITQGIATIASKVSTAAQKGELAAWVARTFAVGANTRAVLTNNALSVSTKAAIIASSAATGIATAAQWAWNAALTANPIGVIIVAIAALVGALVWFFTQTELGQQIWETVTTAIGAAFTWLWESVLQPVFGWIGQVFTWIYENIVIPIVTGIMLYIGIWAAIFTWLWETVLSPVFGWIGQAFTWLYENVIALIVGYIQLQIEAWGAVFTWLYEQVVQPVFAALAAAFTWIWENAISPVVGWISGALESVGSVVSSVFGGIADFIGNAFQAALSVVRGPINGIIGLVNGAIRGVNSLRVTIPDWVPIVGGQTWGLNIPLIPYLATGGVTYGPMLAMVGDNPGGREVVQPVADYERTMLRAFELGRGGSSGGDRPIYTDTGVLLGWIREEAGKQARLVWAEADDGMAATIRAGAQA